MAAPARLGLHISISVPAVPSVQGRSDRRRYIDFKAGRALEVLGHAIEYLTDEYVHDGGSLSANEAQVQAIQLLMAVNRQVYYLCPEAPTFAERCLSIVGLR